MSWGNKLIIVFIMFATLIGTLVYKCTQANFELVTKDYYGEELKYQDQIDGMNNANKLTAVSIAQTVDELSVQLPKELNGKKINAQAWFYCPNNSVNDRKISLKPDDNGTIIIAKTTLAKTKYLLKLNWQAGNENFYNEQSVEIK
jgi:hypothetical protein